MINADDANNRPVQKEITFTVEDVREVKLYANREFLSKPQPPELDGPEFLVLCYTRAVDRVLNKKGVSINITFVSKLPYEAMD